MMTPIYLSDGTAIYDRLTARAFLAEKLESESRIKDFLVYLDGEDWEKEYNDLDEEYDELAAKYDELNEAYAELDVTCDKLRKALDKITNGAGSEIHPRD